MTRSQPLVQPLPLIFFFKVNLFIIRNKSLLLNTPEFPLKLLHARFPVGQYTIGKVIVRGRVQDIKGGRDIKERRDMKRRELGI